MFRATRYPSYYEYNVVCVRDEPEMAAAELEAFADQALAGLAHRRLDFESVAAGEARRSALVQRGAIRAAAGVSDLWIVADDEARVKDLYARLGFRTVCASIEFLLLV